MPRRVAEAVLTGHSLSPVAGAPLPHLGDVSRRFRQIGQRRGSTPGGLFEDPTSGRLYYVKRPRTPRHAANEVLAAWLYRACRLTVPAVHPVYWADAPAVASEYLPGLAPLTALDCLDFAVLRSARHDFAVDAWLANWDAVAAGNLMLSPTRAAVRLDFGGALLFRARGEAKGPAFGERVTETGTLRDPEVNRAARIFGGMSEREVAEDYAVTVGRLSAETVDGLVDALPFDAVTSRTLKVRLATRSADLHDRYAASGGGHD